MRTSTLLGALALLVGLFALPSLQAQSHCAPTSYYPISAASAFNYGSFAPVYPDQFGYVSPSGGHRSYRYLAGRDGLASRRPRRHYTVETDSPLYGRSRTTEYFYDSAIGAHYYESTNRYRPIYNSYAYPPAYGPDYTAPHGTTPYYQSYRPTLYAPRYDAPRAASRGHSRGVTWTSSWGPGQGSLLAEE
jgi:hypothetical protein